MSRKRSIPDWARQVDWTDSDTGIARQVGCSRQWVHAVRRMMRKPNPRDLATWSWKSKFALHPERTTREWMDATGATRKMVEYHAKKLGVIIPKAKGRQRDGK